MKSFSDLEQSKKLEEILPIESADMGWYYSSNPNAARNQMWLGTKPENADIPCWSLAALLDVLPKYELNNFGNTIQLDVNLESLATEGDETLLDLVVNMIIHLHEIKML